MVIVNQTMHCKLGLAVPSVLDRKYYARRVCERAYVVKASFALRRKDSRNVNRYASELEYERFRRRKGTWLLWHV